MYRILSHWIGVLLIAGIAILWMGCGDDKSTGPPTTGSVSGTVTYRGTPPGEGRIVIALFSVWPPMGPPAHDVELSVLEGTAEYTIPGVSFGTYAVLSVGWRPLGQSVEQSPVGVYGFHPPEDMEPDPVTVSQDNPDLTGVDITADYAMRAAGGPPS